MHVENEKHKSKNIRISIINAISLERMKTNFLFFRRIEPTILTNKTMVKTIGGCV